MLGVIDDEVSPNAKFAIVSSEFNETESKMILQLVEVDVELDELDDEEGGIGADTG